MNDLRDMITGMKARAVIQSRRNRKVSTPHDADLYKQRNRIERCFGRLKHFRHFATRLMTVAPSTSPALSISPPP